MSLQTWLLTGCSRGLGLAYTKELLKTDPVLRIIATCRDPPGASELNSLVSQYKDRLQVVQLDVADSQSIQNAYEKIKTLDMAKDGIDCLINNAAVATAGKVKPTEDTIEFVKKDYATNVFGPIELTLTLLPLLRQGRGKRIITVGSAVGNFGNDFVRVPMGASYSSTKAALQMWTLKLAAELGPEWTVCNMSPGWVLTDMNKEMKKEDGLITPEEAAKNGVELFKRLTPADNWKMWNHDGKVIPW